MNKKVALSAIFFFFSLLVFCSAPAQAQCKLGVPAIKVGVQGAASGPHADYGRQIEMGSTMAMEEINAAGGVLGCKVEIRFMDDENRPPRACATRVCSLPIGVLTSSWVPTPAAWRWRSARCSRN
jgi:hypothetical protein